MSPPPFSLFSPSHYLFTDDLEPGKILNIISLTEEEVMQFLLPAEELVMMFRKL